MGAILAFLVLWALVFAVLAIAAASVPTTVQSTRASLTEALVISAGVAGIATLAGLGALSLLP